MKLVSAVVVFVVPDVRKTAAYYREVLGFQVVEHFDEEEKFAALYRDSIEIIVVQSKYGEVVSNQERYRAGYDAYLEPEEIEDVDTLYTEWKEKGATIVHSPGLTPYGCYEFALKDIDGRRIGICRIEQDDVFFREGKPTTLLEIDLRSLMLDEAYALGPLNDQGAPGRIVPIPFDICMTARSHPGVLVMAETALERLVPGPM